MPQKRSLSGTVQGLSLTCSHRLHNELRQLRPDPSVGQLAQVVLQGTGAQASGKINEILRLSTLDVHNAEPKLFVWTTSAEEILEKVCRAEWS
jgi:hypothetical protein